MLQSLLEDRFKLVSRREIREIPIYELTVAKGGAKLRAGACNTREPNSPPRQRPSYGLSVMDNDTIKATQIDMERFIPMLTFWVKRTVLDKLVSRERSMLISNGTLMTPLRHLPLIRRLRSLRRFRNSASSSNPRKGRLRFWLSIRTEVFGELSMHRLIVLGIAAASLLSFTIITAAEPAVGV